MESSFLNSIESLRAGLTTLLRVEAGVAPVHFPRSSTLLERSGRRRPPLREALLLVELLIVSSKLLERDGCCRRSFLGVWNGCPARSKVRWRGVMGKEKCPKCCRDCDCDATGASFISKRLMLQSSSSSSSSSTSNEHGGGAWFLALSTLRSVSRVSSLESKFLKESCHNMIVTRSLSCGKSLVFWIVRLISAKGFGCPCVQEGGG